jgi:nitroreductase
MFLDLLRRRRSVRRFQTRRVESEKVRQLVEAALRAPSSRGFNPWCYVVVDDPGLLAQLARSKPHGASFLSGAPLGIVVCADPSVSDVWVEDAAIGTILLHLAATDMGLGSCWVQIRKRPHDDAQSAEAFVAGLLDLPPGLRVEAILAIGYPDEDKPGHDPGALLTDKVHHNRFGQGLTAGAGQVGSSI